MYTDEEYEKLKNKANKLQAELDREIAYTRKVNDKNMLLMEQAKDLKRQLADSIFKSEHEKIIDELRMEYETKLSEILTTQPLIHNPNGAGRKRIATKEIADRVLELSEQGLSQGKIAVTVAEEFNIKIKRTTVGEVVRGNYTPPDAE